MRNYRSEWMGRCQNVEDSFVEYISHDEQAHIDDEKFFKLLGGLGFKGINHDSIVEQGLLHGYYEEYDPEAKTESEFDTENGPESKDKKREEQGDVEEGEEHKNNSKEKQEDVESQGEKELV